MENSLLSVQKVSAEIAFQKCERPGKRVYRELPTNAIAFALKRGKSGRLRTAKSREIMDYIGIARAIMREKLGIR